MARSRIRTPMFGHTTSRSERREKAQWHRRWRARERRVLATAAPEDFEEHLTSLAREVSDPWHMSKDGHSYWPLSKQVDLAEYLANQGERLDSLDRSSRKKALLAKWMAK
jgi:hypothetical protein